MTFLSDLSDQLSSQFLSGELPNYNRTLADVVDGKSQGYAKLGDFARLIDKSAERRYVEEGYLKIDQFNTIPKAYSIMMQQPEATVLVKKKMYSSLVNNFNSNYSDQEQKFFMKCLNVLLQNKCKQVAAYERLCKIENVSLATGQIDEQVLPLILGLGSYIPQTMDAGTSSFIRCLEKIKAAYGYSKTSFYTDWVEDILNYHAVRSGSGTGVIELTNFTSINTTTNINESSAGFNIRLSDPYNIMTVTPEDIERAINDTLGIANESNRKYVGKLQSSTQIGKELLPDLISKKITQLNQLRGARGASTISFKVNPDTVYGRRLIAIVDATGQEILFKVKIPGISNPEIPDEYLFGGDVLGNQGIQKNRSPKVKSYVARNNPDRATEYSLFADAINNIYNQMSLETNSFRDYLSSIGPGDKLGGVIGSIRAKLNFYFSGKSIIQPMDEVHVYFNSRTKQDDKVLSGLQNAFNGLGFFQNINNTIYDIKNEASKIASIFSPSENLDIQMEKSMFLDSNIPNFLWMLVRSQFINSREGTHVYAGVVTSSSVSYSQGAYTVSIGGEDNKYYLKMGKVNYKPSVDISNGAIYDPLTPYQTSFGTVFSLKSDKLKFLPENKAILDGANPLIKFTDGAKAGIHANENNLWHDIVQDSSGARKVVLYPDGLVYKWKEGIGVLTQKGDSTSIYNSIVNGYQSTTEDPFANQDIMNIVSFLITGQPYNFATFYAKGLASGGLIKNGDELSANSPLNILKSTIERNNTLWGNFIPYKNLSMDEKSYVQMYSAQAKLTNDSIAYQKLFSEYQQKKYQASMASTASAVFPGDQELIKRATFAIQNLDAQANIIKLQLETSQDSGKPPATQSNFSVVGNDITINYDESINNKDSKMSISDPKYRRFMRRKLNFFTKKQAWQVRANQDKNYFIVEDDYDKDYDLIAQEFALNKNISLYNNEFSDVLTKVNNLIKLYELEFFCDTQGNLRIRSPQYNRMPSQVFYRMIQNSKANGTQFFPKFLTSYFYDQISSLENRLSVIEDQIRLYSILAGVNADLSIGGDYKIVAFLKGAASDQSIGNDLKFITDPEKDTISDFSGIIKIFNSTDTDENKKQFESVKNFNKELQSQLNLSRTFDPYTQGLTLIKITDNPKTIFQLTKEQVVQQLLKRIYDKTGVPVDIVNDYGLVVDRGTDVVKSPKTGSIDAIKVVKDIVDKLKERQRVVKLYYSLIKSASEIMSIDFDDDVTSKLLFPQTMGNKEIPEAFEYLIEDESFDDYGIGSGSRYIIKNSQIKSYTMTETNPEYTTVTVQGKFDLNIPQGGGSASGVLPEAFNAFPGGANALTSAVAVDYDLWKLYGFRSTSALVYKPFFTNPDTQCAPYAVALLSRVRKNILRANVTIIGNEFMQPGEVVYLEDRNMLFYVESVQHSFNEGSSFSTSLSLSYGHYPGEYIPNPLDMIAKMLYNNRDKGDLIGLRQRNTVNHNSSGALVLDPSNKDAASNISAGSYSLDNIANIKNMIVRFNNIKAANADIQNKKVVIELRYYVDSKAGSPFLSNSQLKKFISSIIDKMTAKGEPAPGTNIDPTVSADDVTVLKVDLSDSNSKESMSQAAASKSRDLIAAYGLGQIIKNLDVNKQQNSPALNAALKKYLTNNIVDCFIVIKNIVPSQNKGV